ncbi:MAG: enoyl-CoA hydratase/isomerase family protein [Aggregatilineales bacterium]
MTDQVQTDTLLVEQRGAIVTLTINRPKVRNALDAATVQALGEAIEQYDEHSDVRVVIISGAGGAFSSGADIAAASQPGVTPATVYNMLTTAYAPAIQAIRACPWPVIAAVDGVAAGIGCDVALACDIRLASDRAVFTELFIRVGLIPDGGGTYLLPRLVGLGKALEMMFTGENVPAQEALTLGLANKVYPAATFADDVRAYAEKLAKQAPLALIRGKRAMLAALHDSSLSEAMAREAKYQREIFESEDGFEGFRAFLEKRPPQWKGR